MATITLQYDARSGKARAALSSLLSTGMFRPDERNNAKTLAALHEAKTADDLPTVDTSTIEDFITTVMQ